MNKKSIFGLFGIILVLLFSLSSVMAQNESEVNETIIDEEDVVVLSYPYGAQVRLEQLQKSIEVKIDNANEIIEEIEDKDNSTVDVVRLKEIVEEYESLVEEIESTDMNQSSEVLAELYVELKATAIDLTQEFRSIVDDCFTDEEKVQLRDRINEKEQMRINLYDSQYENYKRMYMAQVVQRNLERLGLQDGSLIRSVENGELNLFQVRNKFMDRLQEMSDYEREVSIQRFRESKTKDDIGNLEMLNQYRKNAQDIVEERGNSRQNQNSNSGGYGDIKNTGGSESGSSATGNTATGQSSNGGNGGSGGDGGGTSGGSSSGGGSNSGGGSDGGGGKN